MLNRLIFALFFSICLLIPVNGYTDTAFTLTFQLSPEKVHVIEKMVFSLDTAEERSAFSTSLRLGRSTVSDWSKYSRNVAYHVHGLLVYTNTTRIVAKPDFSLRHTPGVVLIEYDVSPLILSKTVKSSRVTEYEFNTSMLLLDRLQSKEVVLGNIDELVFEISEGDQFSKVLPDAQERSANRIVFKGPLTSKFELAFIQEKTLSQEVNEFFFQTYSNAANLIPLLLVLALLLFVWFKLVA